MIARNARERKGRGAGLARRGCAGGNAEGWGGYAADARTGRPCGDGWLKAYMRNSIVRIVLTQSPVYDKIILLTASSNQETPMASETQANAPARHPLYRSLWKTFFLSLILMDLFHYNWFKKIRHTLNSRNIKNLPIWPLYVGAIMAVFFYGYLLSVCWMIIFHDKESLSTNETIRPFLFIAMNYVGSAIWLYFIFVIYKIKMYINKKRGVLFYISSPILILFPVMYGQYVLNRAIKKRVAQQK